MRPFSKTTALAAGFTAAVLITAASAQATVSFTLGNNPQQPGEENILFGSSQTGTTIIRTTNQSNTYVQFTNFGQTVMTGGIGQAFIQPESGTALLTSFTFSVPGHAFTDFIFNPQIGGQPQGGGGTALVTAVANDGDFDFSYDLGNGNNFLTIVATDNETLSSVSLSVTGAGFNQLQQPRVSGICVPGELGCGLPPIQAPEPASLALLGGALLGFGVLRRRKQA
jgi:hypothetical protein